MLFFPAPQATQGAPTKGIQMIVDTNGVLNRLTLDAAFSIARPRPAHQVNVAVPLDRGNF
jgi:hypothetical protein